MKVLTFLLLGIYLGLSPIYWWPGVSPQTLDTLKLVLIGSAVVLIWVRAFLNGRAAFPSGVLGPAGFVMLLLVSFMAASQSTLEMSLWQLKDYTLAFIMLWTFTFYINLGQSASRVMAIATLILAAHCALVASSKLLGIPRWAGPRTFVAPELWISGFGSLRTGWSCSVAPFVPIALSMVLPAHRPLLVRVLFAAAAAAIVLSQLVVAGRSGMLASFLGMLWIITGRDQRRWLPVIAAAGVAAIVMAQDFLYNAMRLRELGSGKVDSVHDLNKFSAHRVDSDIIAFKAFLDNPVAGHGFHEFTFGGGTEIHNLWLRLAVEGGALLPLGLAWLVWQVWRAIGIGAGAQQSTKPLGLDTRYLQAIILMGVIMSMLEPRILLGTFQLNTVWWAAAGVAGAQMLMARRSRGAEASASEARQEHPTATSCRIVGEPR